MDLILEFVMGSDITAQAADKAISVVRTDCSLGVKHRKAARLQAGEI